MKSYENVWTLQKHGVICHKLNSHTGLVKKTGWQVLTHTVRLQPWEPLQENLGESPSEGVELHEYFLFGFVHFQMCISMSCILDLSFPKGVFLLSRKGHFSFGLVHSQLCISKDLYEAILHLHSLNNHNSGILDLVTEVQKGWATLGWYRSYLTFEWWLLSCIITVVKKEQIAAIFPNDPLPYTTKWEWSKKKQFLVKMIRI